MCCRPTVVLVAVYIAWKEAELDQINAQRFVEICNSLVQTYIGRPTFAYLLAILSGVHEV